jgi:acyl-CoA hydrolase/GNAT superfamily N-acetyltransferase
MMQRLEYWADKYVAKRRSGSEAIQLIRPGQRVFIGSSCGEPQHLVRELANMSSGFTDLEIVRLLSLETTPLTLIADKTKGRSLKIRSFYLGSAKSRSIAQNKRFITPMNLSAVPRLFSSRRLPVHVALIQVCPPDDFGWMSLGVSVDITLAAAMSADMVIAQVNPKMPKVHGHSFIHANDIDVIVEYQENILTIPEPPEIEAANNIGKQIARLIEDGSTIHISPGTAPQATLLALSDKNDLGIHTEYLTDSIMRLVSMGVITNRKKGHKEGRLVASSAIGTRNLYDFINDNPAIDFEPSDYVNDPAIIARNNKMVSLSVPMAMDLTGQVAADALDFNHFSGVTGMVDFARGAVLSKGGKSILMLLSTSADRKKSRIVANLEDTAVVLPRGDVHFVVTEYGAVNLFGKSLQERAMGMISIAHPVFRDELFCQAKEMGLLGEEYTLKDSIHGIYPFQMEETLKINGRQITVRPAKPVDQRRIQEHFYSLDKDDVIARFFHEKDRFLHEEMEGLTQVDYVQSVTIIALVGEFGFGNVIGVGEYLLDSAVNLAEIAFSVSKPFQGQGLGKILLHKLYMIAQENGIAGFMAYTAAKNNAMIKLFESLPGKTMSAFDGDVLELKCRF